MYVLRFSAKMSWVRTLTSGMLDTSFFFFFFLHSGRQHVLKILSTVLSRFRPLVSVRPYFLLEIGNEQRMQSSENSIDISSGFVIPDNVPFKKKLGIRTPRERSATFSHQNSRLHMMLDLIDHGIMQLV